MPLFGPFSVFSDLKRSNQSFPRARENLEAHADVTCARIRHAIEERLLRIPRSRCYFLVVLSVLWCPKPVQISPLSGLTRPQASAPEDWQPSDTQNGKEEARPPSHRPVRFCRPVPGFRSPLLSAPHSKSVPHTETAFWRSSTQRAFNTRKQHFGRPPAGSSRSQPEAHLSLQESRSLP